jgi:hypothetical protein
LLQSLAHASERPDPATDATGDDQGDVGQTDTGTNATREISHFAPGSPKKDEPPEMQQGRSLDELIATITGHAPDQGPSSHKAAAPAPSHETDKQQATVRSQADAQSQTGGATAPSVDNKLGWPEPRSPAPATGNAPLLTATAAASALPPGEVTLDTSDTVMPEDMAGERARRVSSRSRGTSLNFDFSVLAALGLVISLITGAIKARRALD